MIDKKTDSLVRTDLFHQLETDTIRLRPRLIILDTSADLFGGNEIYRSHTRQFISMLRQLAIAARNACGVLLLTHPSLEGIRSGSGLSGSTAWHNSVSGPLRVQEGYRRQGRGGRPRHAHARVAQEQLWARQ